MSAPSHRKQHVTELRPGLLLNEWDTDTNSLTVFNHGKPVFHITRHLTESGNRFAAISVPDHSPDYNAPALLESVDRLLKSSALRPVYDIDRQRMTIIIPEKAPGATGSSNFANFAQSLKRRLVLPDRSAVALLADSSVKLDTIGSLLLGQEGDGYLMKPESLSGNPAVDLTEFLKGHVGAADVCKVSQAAHLFEQALEL